MDVSESDSPLRVRALVVGAAVAALDAHGRVVVDVVGELAADAAIRAYGGHLALDGREVRVLRRRQRAGGTGLHAFAAGATGRLAHRIVEIEHDLRMRAAE